MYEIHENPPITHVLAHINFVLLMIDPIVVGSMLQSSNIKLSSNDSPFAFIAFKSCKKEIRITRDHELGVLLKYN